MEKKGEEREKRKEKERLQKIGGEWKHRRAKASNQKESDTKKGQARKGKQGGGK